MQLFSARVLVETAYAAKWCAEAIELLQRNSGSTAIMDFERIQRAWRDARVITLHGALNLEALSENYGRLMAGMQPHQFAGITTLDRFAPPAVKKVNSSGDCSGSAGGTHSVGLFHRAVDDDMLLEPLKASNSL